MPLRLMEQDITTMKVDAVVNSTNPFMTGESGVDALIHSIGGPEFERECRALRNVCRPGEAVRTNAYNMNCRYVIHTVSFPWEKGIYGETAILKSCYRSSLELASELGCRSVAFPLISSGNYHYPIADALKCAVTSIREYLRLFGDMDVYLTLYGSAVTRIAETIYGDLDRFVKSSSAREASMTAETGEKLPELEKLLKTGGESFVEMLYRYMRERGIDKPSSLYTKAGITRGAFSKLVGGGSKNPSMKTAVGLAMALKLTYEETVAFLASAGLALSGNNKFDIIVTYFIKTGNYDIWELDIQLARYGYKSLLGA